MKRDNILEFRAAAEQAQERFFSLERFRGFAVELFEDWPPGKGLDGFDLLAIAVRHGLVVPTKQLNPCLEDHCSCAEYYCANEWLEGVLCYRKSRMAGGAE